ncbi:mandelate racemase/muconate lactonizing enzyme family protein [Alphaproteobacteria bacterium]|nr:mandelate racemase/muconate lactonizing enzyme family protein [Alphaproteobacteria bacterium]
MKITNIEVFELKIPFSTGVSKQASSNFLKSDALDFCLVKVETDVGIVGWGDAFSFHCRRAVAEAINTMVKPHLIGKNPLDVQQINFELQKKLHLFGRYGITIFAISAVDIALWDIVAKHSNLPLCNLLGSMGKKQLPAYASLWRYEDAESVQDRCNHAKNLGYKYIKLHEICTSEVKAARDILGDDIPIMVDTNCPWTKDEARQMLNSWEEYSLYWVEEPINPPEDFESLSNLRADTFVPIAAGENACTSFEFKKMFDAEAVDYAQPSVTKVGGITEFKKINHLADTYGVQVMPHSPYFGPGFLATLHLAQSMPNPGLLERFFIDFEAYLYPKEIVTPQDGFFKTPDTIGLGLDPDMDVIKDYAVKTL